MLYNRLIASICALLVLVGALYFKAEKTPLFEAEGGTYTFYLYSSSSNAKIISVSAVEARATFEKITDVCGESLFIPGKAPFAAEQIKRLKARLLFTENVDGIFSEYYYSNKIPRYKSINGYKVNLHVAYSASGTTIGSPIIFGSY